MTDIARFRIERRYDQDDDTAQELKEDWSWGKTEVGIPLLFASAEEAWETVSKCMEEDLPWAEYKIVNEKEKSK